MLWLKNTAALHGIELTGVRADPWQHVDFPVPWIAHLRSRIGHYVVVERKEDNSWIIADPAIGRLQVPDRLIRDRWTGYALIVEGPTESDLNDKCSASAASRETCQVMSE